MYGVADEKVMMMVWGSNNPTMTESIGRVLVICMLVFISATVVVKLLA